MEVFLTPNQVLISCPYFVQHIMEILVTYGLYLFFPNYKYKILHYICEDQVRTIFRDSLYKMTLMLLCILIKDKNRYIHAYYNKTRHVSTQYESKSYAQFLSSISGIFYLFN